MPTPTDAVVDHHLRAFYQGIDPILDDYTDDSVLITNKTTYKGLAEIRSFFTDLIADLPDEGFDEAEKIHRMEIEGEVAFLVWEAKPWFDFCTDTFVVRDGKIRYQTFAAHVS
ncbi:MAG: nuclear transport factor 2 family protein [Actinomycetota bacterium]|nr:nuclear transport factor 2 family protein [Actinomycetota bacterium]